MRCSSSFSAETWGDVRRGLNPVLPARLWGVGFLVRIRPFKELDHLKASLETLRALGRGYQKAGQRRSDPLKYKVRSLHTGE